MNRLKPIFFLLSLFCILSISIALGQYSNPNAIDPETIPPDVTLSNSQPVKTTTPPPTNTQQNPNSSQNRLFYPDNNGQPAANQITMPNGMSSTPVPNQQLPAAKPKCPTCGKKDPIAIIETTKGTIIIRLYRKLAPRTVANFIDLSEKGFFNNLKFHRVVPGFVIQTGCPRGDGTGGYIEPGTSVERRLPLELSTQLKHNAPGVVAMAHAADPNSASSQFYITLSPEPSLDNQYSIFGGVVQGMDVANQINTSDRVLTTSVQERE